jgi:glyoxylase-like metal-dependent hydrolase (beta-lactamase superfamily II)
MTRLLTGTAVVLVAALAVTLGRGSEGAQGAPPAGRGGDPRMPAIEQVNPALYVIRLPNPGSTVVARVTSEGVILVDDMYENHYEPILELLKTVTPLPVKYVISTHHHGDHTGANVKFLQHAQILGHKNARAAMTGGEKPLPGPPPITYTTEAAVHLGGVEVQLHYVGRGHTNGDTVVYFPDLRVIAAGDLFFMIDRPPVVDYANGGTSLGWLPTIDNILQFDFETVIPGHGPVSVRADLVRFKQRMETLQARVRALIRAGVQKDQYLTKLKVDDLGWTLDPSSVFMRLTASGFYDELAATQ